VTNTSGRTFLLKPRSLRSDDQAIRDLRLVLKKLLRRCGFRCVSVSEEQNNER
jgi:hypothetical protein